MTMVGQGVAALVLGLCLALLLRLALPERARDRFDARMRALRDGVAALSRRLRHGRRRRLDAERLAAREAQALIRRAQRGARRGADAARPDAIRPDALKRPRKPH